MRRVSSGDKRWQSVGVGSDDAASLLNLAFNVDETVLWLWARIVGKRITKRMKTAQLAQGTDEWKLWRRAGVGGSEIAAVVGMSPYSDSKADKIWSRKLPPDHPNALPEVADNKFMSHGRKFEPEARTIYERLFGWKVDPICVLHSEWDYARASLDGWNDDMKLVWECKCPAFKNHQRYLNISVIDDPFQRQSIFAQEFPAYRYQTMYQMALTSAEMCHFVSYQPQWDWPEDRLVVIPLYPEPTEQVFLLERLRQFWEFVLSESPPPAEWMIPCGNPVTELKIPDRAMIPTNTATTS